MISQVRIKSFKNFSLRGMPPFFSSMIIAELFFKFHSFTLETIAFLSLWYVTDYAYSMLPIFSKRITIAKTIELRTPGATEEPLEKTETKL